MSVYLSIYLSICLSTVFPLISAAFLSAHIEISASPLISAAPLMRPLLE